MLTGSLDSIGGMAKSAADLSFLTELLLSTSGAHLKHGVSSILATEWQDLKIGFVDPELWQLPASLLQPSESYRQQTVGVSILIKCWKDRQLICT